MIYLVVKTNLGNRCAKEGTECLECSASYGYCFLVLSKDKARCRFTHLLPASTHFRWPHLLLLVSGHGGWQPSGHAAGMAWMPFTSTSGSRVKLSMTAPF